MSRSVPDHSDDSVLIELYGPENDGWYTSRIHDWIGVCDELRDPDARGYMVLRALVYEKFKKPIRNLTLGILCELIPGPNGKPSSQGRVRGILTALSNVGLISTPEGGPIKTSSRANAASKPLRIRINDMPKEGYTGWRNVEAKLKWLQAGKPEPGAGQNSDPGGRNSDPHSGGDQQEPDHPLVPSLGADDASFGGVASGGRRRPPTGSSAREVEGGSAASSKDDPSPQKTDGRQPSGGAKKSSSKKPRHTRQQLTLVRAVRAHYPADFAAALPDVWELSQAILEALAGDVPGAERTVDQLGARIEQRWNHHGWASKFYAGELERPVGAAVAMVRPLKSGDRYGCANPRCEAGYDVDTGAECHVCPERLAERKAERRQKAHEEGIGAQEGVPPQRPANGYVPPRECPCGDPIGKTAEDPLCDRCRRDADEAEETARLRAQLAAQFGTPDQVEAYSYGSAPF